MATGRAYIWTAFYHITSSLTGLDSMKQALSGGTRLVAVLCLTLFASACAKPPAARGALNVSYLTSGEYIGENGEPVNKTSCSTKWVLVPNSDPKRWTCSGTVSGSGALEF